MNAAEPHRAERELGHTHCNGTRHLARCATLLVCLLAGACGDSDKVVISGPEGELRLSVDVDIASTATERTQGLRGRESLAATDGLLLSFPTTGQVCIVNDGVPFAIDAVYIAEDRRVIAVERAIPAGDPNERCHNDTRFVLEVSAGAARSVTISDFTSL